MSGRLAPANNLGYAVHRLIDWSRSTARAVGELRRWGMTNRRWANAALLAGALVIPLPVSAANIDAAASTEYAQEASARQLEEDADSEGALGVYFDAANKQFAVVMPRDTSSSSAANRAQARGLDVRVEKRDIDRTTIDRIDTQLARLRETLPAKYAYAYSFDPQTGAVEVETNAPIDYFSAISAAFPKVVVVRSGVLEMTSGTWTNDQPPHWGGAYLQSATSVCTSGWTLKTLSDNKKYMVTAGHCFPNGTSTNMGTSWRETAAFPSIDVELIRGKTYAGYIYADGASGERRVNDGNDPVIGSSYCITGRSSGFKCGWVAKQKGVKFCYLPEGCTFNLIMVQNGSQLFQLGDSGGPFFIKGGNLTVGIRGIVVARYYDGITTKDYVQGFNVIADYYRAVIVTS